MQTKLLIQSSGKSFFQQRKEHNVNTHRNETIGTLCSETYVCMAVYLYVMLTGWW